MQWLHATYQPTSLFSLKPSWATSSGGKSLLLPTPYALKIALLDVAIRVTGVDPAAKAWPWLRDLQIGIQLPEQIVVTNLFARILKLRRNPAVEGSADVGPFQKTIAYREYVYHADAFELAFGVPAQHVSTLVDWLIQINYLGKRGGFMQLLNAPQPLDDDTGFVSLTTDLSHFPPRGLVQQVDDCDPRLKFEQVNIYTSARPKRVIRQVVLPYRLKRSSRSYSLYERIT